MANRNTLLGVAVSAVMIGAVIGYQLKAATAPAIGGVESQEPSGARFTPSSESSSPERTSVAPLQLSSVAPLTSDDLARVLTRLDQAIARLDAAAARAHEIESQPTAPPHGTVSLDEVRARLLDLIDRELARSATPTDSQDAVARGMEAIQVSRRQALRQARLEIERADSLQALDQIAKREHLAAGN